MIFQSLLPRLWIGEGDYGFQQDITFKWVLSYCTSCRHFGHSTYDCYIANSGLQKPQQPISESQGKDIRDEGKQLMSIANVQPQVPTIPLVCNCANNRHGVAVAQPPFVQG